LASGYLITGGLHLDGLMDTFDGIFAGKKKRLKAMKDSNVGSFGVQSLVFVTLIQIACILKIQDQIIIVLPICLFWGRFSNLFFIEKFQYMSYKKKSISHKKFWNGFQKESLFSIIFLLIFIAYQLFSITSQAILIKFLFLILIGIFLSYSIPNLLGNKIGGFNGDACGASIVLVETAILFMHAILL
jgi:adenosylcobinamide-GDP ribazoletransferase